MRLLARTGVGLAMLVCGGAVHSRYALSQPINPQANLASSFYKASVRASRSAGHLVAFETGADANSGTAASFSRAAALTSEALVSIGSRPAGKCALTAITDVVITAGVVPSARAKAGRLAITIVPPSGAEGFPSIHEIEDAVGTTAASCA